MKNAQAVRIAELKTAMNNLIEPIKEEEIEYAINFGR
jgi:hypothetical protein